MQYIRLAGAISSGLVCAHSVSYLYLGSGLRLVHNLADVILFVGFGVSGLVAELFPRDSVTYSMLKANFPFLVTRIGRGIFYLILGCLVMGDYSSDPSRLIKEDGEEDHSSFAKYFTIGSGMFIALTGIAELYLALKNRSARSLQSAELSHPIVAFVPSAGIVARAPQRVEVEEEQPV